MAEFDVLGLGNAIMDVIAPVDEDFLDDNGIIKGAMTLIDEERAVALHGMFKNPTEISGGSAANTLAGIASLGLSGAYIGKVADGDVGERFAAGLRDEGLVFDTEPLIGGPATARCLIAVTPDGERSMNTFLGASTEFSRDDVDEDKIRNAKLTYLEGYLFDKDSAKRAFVHAAEVAQAAGRKVALTLSDTFCVVRHRDAFMHLVDHHVDILFANEAELATLYGTADIQTLVDMSSDKNLLTVLTRSAKGSIIIGPHGTEQIEAFHETKVVDTTGAGDLYAAGVLAGLARGLPIEDVGRLGAICAAEVISHYGARPKVSLKELAAKNGIEI